MQLCESAEVNSLLFTLVMYSQGHELYEQSRLKTTQHIINLILAFAIKNGYQFSFSGVKRSGPAVDYPPPSSTEVGRVWVELYLCLLFVPAYCVTAFILYNKDKLITHILLCYSAYVSEIGTGNTVRIEHETYRFYSK
jgi:hypothetical protein